MGKKQGIEEISQPAVCAKLTLHQDMPKQVLEVMEREKLNIKLDKIHAARLIDQLPGMIATDGCISAPSGPSC